MRSTAWVLLPETQTSFVNTAEQVKQSYLDYIKSVDTESAAEELKEEEKKHEPAGDLAKLLRDDREADR